MVGASSTCAGKLYIRRLVMQVIRSDEGAPRQGTTFTGRTMLTTMLGPQQVEGLRLTIVEFEDGAVTNCDAQTC